MKVLVITFYILFEFFISVQCWYFSKLPFSHISHYYIFDSYTERNVFLLNLNKNNSTHGIQLDLKNLMFQLFWMLEMGLSVSVYFFFLLFCVSLVYHHNLVIVVVYYSEFIPFRMVKACSYQISSTIPKWAKWEGNSIIETTIVQRVKWSFRIRVCKRKVKCWGSLKS